MKKIFLIISIISLTQIACKKPNSARFTPTSLDGKWRMILVKDNASGSITNKPSSIQNDVDITFISENSDSGTFSGNTPTNDIWKNGYSTGANQTITIPVLAMTKVAETSWGNEFVSNIRDSKEYSFEIDGRLDIKTINKTLIFQKQ